MTWSPLVITIDWVRWEHYGGLDRLRINWLAVEQRMTTRLAESVHCVVQPTHQRLLTLG